MQAPTSSRAHQARHTATRGNGCAQSATTTVRRARSGTEQRDTSSSAQHVRNDQINQIKKYITDHYHENDHVIVGGDFNMGPQTSTKNYHLMINQLKDCMEHIHEHERITWNPKNPLARNRVIHDPAKQIDGFYMKHSHYDQLKDRMVLNRMFLDEISFEHDSKTVSTMISDHYGVELIIKKAA